MQTLIKKLYNKKYSIYEAVEELKKSPNRYIPQLKVIVTNNKSAYLRLLAAWALGEIQDKDSFNLLLRRYEKEKEDNVRANIVKALYFIDSQKVSVELTKKLLSDKYYLIQLLSLKFFALTPGSKRKLNFKYYFNNLKSEFVKKELLNNMRFFYYDDGTICKFLYSNLLTTKSTFLKINIITAIGLVNSPLSLNYLIKYYEENRQEVEQNQLLAYGFASAIVSLNQSKAFYILSTLYLKHKNLLVRWKIFEALVGFGGPRGIKILKDMVLIEKNKELKMTILRQIKNMPITSV